jgi:class 3 adenylate cyclase
MVDLPSGTVTFLFTDLEGSTRLWEGHPEEMRLALARHDAILRSSVAARGGAIVKSTGDGIHAVFASAHDGLEAAVDAQRVLSTESWPVATPIRVRMGLHSGEAEHRDGDYYGTATNRAARLMSVAHGGQVLVSLSTEELLSDDLPEGVGLADVGEHRLRDLSRPERVFQVIADGLTREFPPIRSLDAYPGNLPVQLTSFVGRHEELVALGRLLRDVRLVTVTGTGGVGKTRIAVQLAAEVLQRCAKKSTSSSTRQKTPSSLARRVRCPLLTTRALKTPPLAPIDLRLTRHNCRSVLPPGEPIARQISRSGAAVGAGNSTAFSSSLSVGGSVT